MKSLELGGKGRVLSVKLIFYLSKMLLKIFGKYDYVLQFAPPMAVLTGLTFAMHALMMKILA